MRWWMLQRCLGGRTFEDMFDCKESKKEGSWRCLKAARYTILSTINPKLSSQ